MQAELKTALREAVKKLFGVNIEPELTSPDEQFGDYSTNVAMQLAAKVAKNPRQIAEAVAAEIEGASVAGGGFINVKMSDQAILKAATQAATAELANAGQEILVEFGDPNPFKEMHIGHVYSYVIGDAIASLLEASGAKVHRLSYHGDVGLHVAKAIYGLKKEGVKPAEISVDEKFNIGQYYALGAKAHEADAEAKDEIGSINKHVYEQDHPEINELYKWGREQSLAYFDQILEALAVKPPKQFFEDQAAVKGARLVEENSGKVFEKSDGALVYKGEKVGLHTRVFITSKGLPTYEAKDLGLAELKKEAYPSATASLIITAHEQMEYFKVMLAALAEIDPKAAAITKHLAHGFVSLSTGKMSSRTGEVYGASDLIVDVDKAVEKQFGKESSPTRNAAIKYGFLKHRLGSDIVYDIAESVSLEGNSGPYLQYAHARACSILAKAAAQIKSPHDDLDKNERSLARKIAQYPEIVSKATDELMPHHISTYLYELAQNFNRFYENSRIIGDEREPLRLLLVKNYRDVLAHGLKLLNIEAPERV